MVYKKLGAANCVTIIRLLLVLTLSFLLAKSHGQMKIFLLVLFLLVLNYAGDIVDGYLARLLNQETKLGAILDVSVDALLLLSAYFILAYRGVIGYYLFCLTLVSLLQFVFSSLWIKRFSSRKPIFTFDALGHYSIVLIEAMLILNIACEFITNSNYVRIINYMDLPVIIIGAVATLNRFRYYFAIPGSLEA